MKPTSQTIPSFTKDRVVFARLLQAFGSGALLPCLECETPAPATRLFYMYSTSGRFILGAVLCEEHHAGACDEANRILTHKVKVIDALPEGENN